MTDHTDPHIIGLFLLLHRLQRTGRPLGRDTIVPFAKIKLPRVAQMYVALIGRLLEEKLIEGDAERFTLCPNALDVIQDVSQKHSLHTLFYNAYYLRQSYTAGRMRCSVSVFMERFGATWHGGHAANP